MVEQFMQKNCIKSILLKIIKSSVCLCIIMERTVIYLLMVLRLKQKTKKNTDIVVSPLGLGSISKDFSVDNKKKNRIQWICL